MKLTLLNANKFSPLLVNIYITLFFQISLTNPQYIIFLHKCFLSCFTNPSTMLGQSAIKCNDIHQ